MRATFIVFMKKWFPAFLVMGLIFLFSSTPSSGLPDFGFWDWAIKKGAHFSIYGLLSLSYLRGFQKYETRSTRWVAALVCALIYAITDEFHQSFTPGRNPSLGDVGIDLLGASAAVLAWRYSSLVKQIVKYGVN